MFSRKHILCGCWKQQQIKIVYLKWQKTHFTQKEMQIYQASWMDFWVLLWNYRRYRLIFCVALFPLTHCIEMGVKIWKNLYVSKLWVPAVSYRFHPRCSAFALFITSFNRGKHQTNSRLRRSIFSGWVWPADTV